jgi:uncharacterized protein YndB with AHSA1/START domain
MPGKWPLAMKVTVTFGKHAKGTWMTLWHTGIPSAKMRELTEGGWNESFDKLAEVLRRKGAVTGIEARPGKPEIVMTRTFAAPRDLVFRAYTEPDLIPRWWGPDAVHDRGGQARRAARRSVTVHQPRCRR